MHQNRNFGVWREGVCSNSFSMYCLFYSLAWRSQQRREERSSIKSLLRNSKENKCSKIRMQIELCVRIQRGREFHGNGFAGVTSLWQGAGQGVNHLWGGDSTALRSAKVFRQVLGREFQLFHSFWSQHCDTIPKFCFIVWVSPSECMEETGHSWGKNRDKMTLMTPSLEDSSSTTPCKTPSSTALIDSPLPGAIPVNLGGRERSHPALLNRSSSYPLN